MIFNYDKENIGNGIGGSGFTILDAFKQKVPEVSKEVQNFFKQLDALPDKTKASFYGDSELLTLFAKNCNIANDDFLDFLKTADTSGDLMAQYQSHLEQTTKSTSAIELAAKAWDNYSHSQEKAKERGDTALSKSNQKSTVQNTLYECTLQSAFTLERM